RRSRVEKESAMAGLLVWMSWRAGSHLVYGRWCKRCVRGNPVCGHQYVLESMYNVRIPLCECRAEERAMEATVAERGQITLPKAVRDALGLTKGTLLKVELEGGRIILRKNVDDAISRARGRFKLPEGVSTDDVMRELRGRAPGDPVEP